MKWLLESIQLWVLRRKIKDCYDAAFLICLIGQDNEYSVQRHLNEAKDSLYSAASCFKRIAASIRADRTFRRHRRFARKLRKASVTSASSV